MKNMHGAKWERVPDGWSAASFFGRVAIAGLCSYAELANGLLGVADVFEMHRMLDYRDCTRLKAEHEMKRKRSAPQR